MVKIFPQSKKYIDDTLGEYTKTDKLPGELTGRTILHIYSVADTMTESGDLEGFQDALFFDVHVYMCDSKTFYVIESRDQVEMNIPARVRIFKDGSTMIIIDKPIKIGVWQSLEINSAYN